MRGSVLRSLIAGFAALSIAGGCAPPPRPAAVAPSSADARAAQKPSLDVFTTSLLTDGQTAHIRGRVKNPSPLRVEGIRYVVTVYPPDSLQPLDTIRTETGTVLEPNAEAPLRLDPQSVYFGSSRFRFSILAVPVKLGGQEMPPP